MCSRKRSRMAWLPRMVVVVGVVVGVNVALSSQDEILGAEGISLEFVTATRTQIVLQWVDTTGRTPTGYCLERSESSDFSPTTILMVPAKVRVYSDTGFSPGDSRRFTSTQLEFGVEYHYRIRARYGFPFSEYSNSVTGTLSDPVRGESGDLWADVVLGQPDFLQNPPGRTVPDSVQMGGGVLIDTTTTPQRAFLVDANHSRILGFSDIDLLPLYPSIVIGQPDFYTSGQNGEATAQRYPELNPPSASTLALSIPDQLSVGEVVLTDQLALDADHALYVPDVYNHRVLKYEDPFATDSVADEVWGQPGFSTGRPNMGGRSGRSLFFMQGHTSAGVAIDPFGSLWVADSGNQRVLRFPREPSTGTIAKSADLVLGQPSFTAAIDRYYYPTSIQVAQDGVVYVAELQHREANPSRVIVYQPPLQIGMPPTRVLAQNPVVCRPNYLFLDPLDRGLWVQNIESWVSTTKLLDLSSGQALYTIHTPQSRGLGVDRTGRVAIHFLDEGFYLYSPPYTDDLRTFLFKDSVIISAQNFWQVKGVTTFGDQLIIGDSHRLLIWNDAKNVKSYDPADDIWGQEDFSANDRSKINQIGYPTVDPKNRLWLTGAFRRGEMMVLGFMAFAYPLRHDSRPIKEVWDTYELVDRTATVTLSEPPEWLKFDCADDGDQIWIPDQMNHRVLRVNNIDGENDASRGPYVDVVLGQHDAVSTQPNQGGGIGPDTLFRSQFVTMDPEENLYVSDNSGEGGSNQRILFFEKSLFPDDLDHVLYAVPATRALGTGGSLTRAGCVDETCAPLEISFAPGGEMVVGMGAYNPNGQRFPLAYLSPREYGRPHVALGDFSAVLNYSHVDPEGNVYLGDYCWTRVLIYKRPFIRLARLDSNHPPRAVIATEPDPPRVALSSGQAAMFLDGQGSHDGDVGSQPLSFLWSKLSGPAGDEVEAPTASRTRVGFGSPGTYTYRLTVDDGRATDSAEVAVTVLQEPIVAFLRSDANADGAAEISDAVAILGFLFLGSPMNDCLDAADVNDNGKLDISDPVRLLGHLFLGSDRPPDPFGTCGVDPTGDDLDCKTFGECP